VATTIAGVDLAKKVRLKIENDTVWIDRLARKFQICNHRVWSMWHI